MLASEIGRQILDEKPRVNSETWPLEEMLKLKEGSFGFEYATWMTKLNFNSNDRPLVKYVQDLELAYIIQRYREIHDALHILLGYDVSVPAELAVKWYEMSALRLPSSTLSSFLGPLNLLGRGNLTDFHTL